MNTIAQLAGVGVGTVYRNFPTREVLLESLAMDSLEKLVAEARTAADDDPTAGLARLLHAVLGAQLNDAGLGAVLSSSESAYAQTSELKEALSEAVSRLLGRARKVGAIQVDVSANDLRRLLCGVEHAVRIGTTDHTEADRYLAILLKGLRP